MSFIALLHYEDHSFKLLECTVHFKQEVDYNNCPNGPARLKATRCVLEATQDTHLLEWAIANYKLKNLVLEYQPIRLDSKSRKYYFYDSNCHFYREHFNHEGKTTYRLIIEFESAIFKTDDIILEKHWKITDLSAKDVVQTTRNEEPETQIVNIEWLNPENNKKIERIDYNEKASLTAQIENPKDLCAKITIEKQDGTEFENGKKQLFFEEDIAEDGSILLSELLIEEIWEENKKVSVDKLIATIENNGINKKSDALKLIPTPQVVADFREADKYDGEYGFDYMRDKSEKKDSITYKDILGTNKTVSGSNVFTKYLTDTKYDSLKDDHYTTLTFPWYKDSAGKEIEYLQSWLTIYPGDTQKLSLQLDTIDNPEKMDLSFEYDTSFFKLSTDIVPAQGNGKKRLKDYFTIECLKEFDTNQEIKVMYKKRQLGQLMVLKNDILNRKKVQVVFVNVETNLKGTGRNKKGNTTNSVGKPEKEMLERYLKQTYTKLELDEIVFDLTALDPTTKKSKYPDFNKNYTLLDIITSPISPPEILNKYHNKSGDNLAEYMEKILNKELPKYNNYFKVFFFGDTGGRKDAVKKIVKLAGYAKDFNTQSAIMFSGKRKATVTHELLHCIGLKHSFSDSADFGYKKNATENIMDYSTTRKHTWLWQWKQLWENKDIKNE